MKEKILNVAFILFGLFMANSGLNKFTNHLPMEASEALQEVFRLLSEIGWVLPLVGFVEFVGGLLIVFPKYRLLGSMMLLPVLTGILLTHIVNDVSMLPIAIVLFTINASVLLINRKKIFDIVC